MDLPLNMRKPRSAGKAHFYVDPTHIDIYPNNLGRVRINRRQIKQILKVMADFEKNRYAKHRLAAGNTEVKP